MELAQPGRTYSSARILVVDNEATNLRTLSRILLSAGYTNVATTTDPTRVMALVAEQEPGLVLLDLHMPVLDGVAVLERLAEVAAPQSYMPVMVLTGDSSQQARRRALVYRKAWAPENVLEHIRSQAGTHFDPALTRLCVRPLLWQAFLAVRGR